MTLSTPAHIRKGSRRIFFTPERVQPFGEVTLQFEDEVRFLMDEKASVRSLEEAVKRVQGISRDSNLAGEKYLKEHPEKATDALLSAIRPLSKMLLAGEEVWWGNCRHKQLVLALPVETDQSARKFAREELDRLLKLKRPEFNWKYVPREAPFVSQYVENLLALGKRKEPLFAHLREKLIETCSKEKGPVVHDALYALLKNKALTDKELAETTGKMDADAKNFASLAMYHIGWDAEWRRDGKNALENWRSALRLSSRKSFRRQLKERLWRHWTTGTDKKGKYSNILDAALDKNIAAVKKFVKADPNSVKETDESGRTALHIASHLASKEMVELLLEKGADPNKKDISGRTPVDFAIVGSNPVIEKALKSHGGKDSLVLIGAAKANDVITARSAIEQGTNIHGYDPSGMTALHWAAKEGNVDVARLLIEKGASLKASSWYGSKAPISLAIEKEQKDIILLLLEKGQDLKCAVRDAWTALHVAVIENQVIIAGLLIEKGADTEVRNHYNGGTPLHLAASSGKNDFVLFLIQKGANVNGRPDSGATPLHSVAVEGYVDTAELLLKKGADIEARDKLGRTALYFAAAKGQTELVKFLHKKGADINAKSKAGFTPLGAARLGCAAETVEFLVSKKAGSGSE